jgi:hypothetical protein
MVAVAVSVAFVGTAKAQSAADVQLWDTSWAQYQFLESIPLPVRQYEVRTSDLTIVINAPIKKVFDIYSNVGNALGLHPFLTSITPIRHTCTQYDFIAYESIPLPDGTIFPGVTIAQQNFHRRQNSYDADSFDIPGIVTHQHISFTKLKGGATSVTEHLTFEAPGAYIDLTQQGGTYAHYLVQLGIKAKIEANAIKAVPFPRYLGGHDEECDDGDDD